ncbi:MAG TPA: very short patch repair endonuclease [Verrucomicrobiae bacterium]
MSEGFFDLRRELPAENASAILAVVADTFNKAERSRIMAAVRSRGNKATELILMQLFRAAGLKGWRRHAAILGRPDFVFTKERVAVFVDGCFWHGCAQHCRMPASNRKYWVGKIERNMRRDRMTRKTLRAEGWKVVRVWEHELKRRPGYPVARIVRALRH